MIFRKNPFKSFGSRARSSQRIISEIESFEPLNGNWSSLDELVQKLWLTKNPEIGMDALFNIFERFPTENGQGVFWTILHGLETLDYEYKLQKSLLRKPSQMGIIMLKRIKSSGQDEIVGMSINELKNHIRVNSLTEPNLLDEL